MNAPIDARPDPPPNKPAALDPGRLSADILLAASRAGFSPILGGEDPRGAIRRGELAEPGAAPPRR